MIGRKLIASERTGTRVILGTDHPVLVQLERHETAAGEVSWVVLVGLCNGVPACACTFDRARSAQSYYEDCLDQGVS